MEQENKLAGKNGSCPPIAENDRKQLKGFDIRDGTVRLVMIKRRRNKMRQSILLLLAVLVLLMIACEKDEQASPNNNVTITGSGNIVSSELALSGFDQIVAGLSFQVAIDQGKEFRAVVSADDNLIEYIQAEIEGTTLNLGLKPDYAYNMTGTTMRVAVTVPDLAGLRLSGSAQGTLNDFGPVNKFSADLSGSSSLHGELEADSVDFHLAGSSFVILAGSGRTLVVDTCGASVADLESFLAKDAELHVSCASMAVVNVEGNLEGEVSQNSRVYYVGQASSDNIIIQQSAAVGPKS